MFQTIAASSCSSTTLQNNANTGEIYSNISRCFQGNVWLTSSTTIPVTTIARCFQYCCVNGTSLYVRVGDKWTICPSQTNVNVPYYNGQVQCPPIAQICPPGYTSPWVSDEITNPLLNQGPNPWYYDLRDTLRFIPSFYWTIFAIILLSALIFSIIFSFWAIAKRLYDRRKKKKGRKQVDENGIEIVDITDDMKDYLREQARALSEEKWKRNNKGKEVEPEIERIIGKEKK